jgi:AraC-like DNA-binding protein
MYTEPNITDLPRPRKALPVRLLEAPRWLRALRADRTDVEFGRLSRHGIRSGMITQRRTAESRYGSHYLFYSPEAELRVQVLDGTFPAAPGTLLWFPPGPPYALYTKPDPEERRLMRFRFTARNRGRLLTPWRRAQAFPATTWYPAFLEEVEREMLMPDEHTPERSRSLLVQLSIRLLRARRRGSAGASPLSPLQVHAVYKYFLRHVSERPASAELAAVVGLSPSYFARLFTRTMGIPPRKWMLRQRIAHSTQLLLDTCLNVSEIAYRLGYEEPRLFTRQFSAEMGMSPRQYRNRAM